MSRPHTAEAMLERILYILPAAAREGGVAIQDLARELDVTPSRVIGDLEEVTARAFSQPAGTVDPFTILVEQRRVKVFAPKEFGRPVRLSSREALALGLGLRCLAADADDERRQQILDLADRLEAGLATRDEAPAGRTPQVADDGVEYEAQDLTMWLGNDGFRGLVSEAIEARVLCELWYLKPGDSAPEQRVIAPHSLIYAEGTWYIAAYDVVRDAPRFFRMDRVLDAKCTEQPAPPFPPDFDEVVRGAPYIGVDEVEVTMRYAPEVAGWVAEQCGVSPEDDGSVVVSHRVADPRWVVRHVLQYGGAAVVSGPADSRLMVQEKVLGMVVNG